jgi:hypothetical protein
MISLDTEDQRRFYVQGYLFGLRNAGSLPSSLDNPALGDLSNAAKLGFLDARSGNEPSVEIPEAQRPAPPLPPNPSPGPAPTPEPPKPAPTKPARSSPTVDRLTSKGDTRPQPTSAETTAAYAAGYEGRAGVFSDPIQRAFYEAGKKDRAANGTPRVEIPPPAPVPPPSGSGYAVPVAVGAGLLLFAAALAFGAKRKRRAYG